MSYALAQSPPLAPSPAPDGPMQVALARENQSVAAAWVGVAAVSGAASAYHGYRRHRGSIGAAVGWGLLGFVFPIITPVVALAQGYAEPSIRHNRGRRRRRAR
jgi:hypothetical protein